MFTDTDGIVDLLPHNKNPLAKLAERKRESTVPNPAVTQYIEERKVTLRTPLVEADCRKWLISQFQDLLVWPDEREAADMVIFDSFPQPPKVATELTERTAPDAKVVTELTTGSDCSK
ncbi:uncharacterized protein F5891DRAFT_1283520 [Suillus fuscotomentosus]|uniref:Uncharacterized protein n=1 Tax=Suillus fuscotomentosus TaxID=1912939 RepID=A0AAD4DNX0_9AGAM|nr:uncharacterized protein F5891DRAFT_1283520 [Suillus fuscotomentosus]KAG1886953.1 hypothetical protein F5891DRAFT_1283520 [Suillus fuscotomentosus]